MEPKELFGRMKGRTPILNFNYNYNHVSLLTIFISLYQFRVAWLSFESLVERRQEELILCVLFQVDYNMGFAGRIQYGYDVVVVSIPALVSESDVQALFGKTMFLIRGYLDKNVRRR